MQPGTDDHSRAKTPASAGEDGGRAVTAPPAQQELLSRIWRQSLPLMRDRIATLERAAARAAEGVLDPEGRTEACDLAHKLAGSLGMFGFPRGTEIARAIEQLLEEPGTDPVQFRALAAELRAHLPL